MKKEKLLIIGGSSGMGLATAQLALEKNYEVIIASRSIEKLTQAKKQLNNNLVTVIQVDSRNEDSIKKLFTTVGEIEHLVIPGSEVKFGDIKTSSVIDAQQSFDSKFFGPFRVIQQAIDYLQPNGSITLFSGSAGAKPEKGTEILSAINSAVEGFARALAISLSPLRVNVIAPGIIDTPVFEGIDEATRKLFQQFTENLLVKRMGQAQEVAQAVLYLVNNQYVTGTTMYVDGGHCIS